MGYTSNVALQFPNKEEQAKFEREYIDCGEARAKDFYNLFNHADEVIKNEFGEVTYCWDWIKFYPEFPEVNALTDTLETNKYNCIFIRLGEDYEDVEHKCYGWDSKQWTKPIYIKQEIVVD